MLRIVSEIIFRINFSWVQWIHIKIIIFQNVSTLVCFQLLTIHFLCVSERSLFKIQSFISFKKTRIMAIL